MREAGIHLVCASFFLHNTPNSLKSTLEEKHLSCLLIFVLK